jgi:hypothetical protein
MFLEADYSCGYPNLAAALQLTSHKPVVSRKRIKPPTLPRPPSSFSTTACFLVWTHARIKSPPPRLMSALNQWSLNCYISMTGWVEKLKKLSPVLLFFTKRIKIVSRNRHALSVLTRWIPACCCGIWYNFSFIVWHIDNLCSVVIPRVLL